MAAQDTIVVGVDGTAESDVAVRWAAKEAAVRGRSLRLLHAYSWPAAFDPMGAYPGPGFDPMDGRRAAEGVINLALANLREDEPDLPTPEVTIVERQRIAAVLDASVGAAMIVVGSRRLGAVGSRVLGSIGSAVAARAACPAVIVRGPAGRAEDGAAVVVGIDLGPMSEPVLRVAFDHAARHGVPLRAVLCWNVKPTYRAWAGRAAADFRGRGDRMMAEALAGWQEKYPDVTVQRQLLDAHPVDGLIGAALGANLLVVGSVGRHGARTMLGSVSQGVLHHATCPVAVAHAGDYADTLT